MLRERTLTEYYDAVLKRLGSLDANLSCILFCLVASSCSTYCQLHELNKKMEHLIENSRVPEPPTIRPAPPEINEHSLLSGCHDG